MISQNSHRQRRTTPIALNAMSTEIPPKNVIGGTADAVRP